MALVSDDFHSKKLKEYGINIKTKYFVGNKIYERNTDNSINDDINSGIRCEKEYYKNNKLIHKEKEFDSRIEYTFISKETEDKDYKCPNCGMESKLKEFVDGCPYCGTYYNIDYIDKDLGSKYHYDRVLRNNSYRIITGIIDIIISIIISFFYIKTTSRTFNNIDIYKIFIYGFILSLVLYYFFYILDAYIILGPIKRYKDRQNQKQINFWEKTQIDKKSFFNNFNYEVRKYYYSKKDIIDFDILDYIEFNEYNKKDDKYIKVIAEVRLVYYDNGRVRSKYCKEEYNFKKNPNDKLELKDGVNIMKCHNCGASINVSDGVCSYCHSEIKYLQEWILENN
jgi:rubrerythrin